MDQYEDALASLSLKPSENFFAVDLADFVALARADPFECVAFRNIGRVGNVMNSLRFS